MLFKRFFCKRNKSSTNKGCDMKPQRWILGIGRAQNGLIKSLSTDLITETRLAKCGGICKIGKTYQLGPDSDEPIYTIMRIFDPYNAPAYVMLFTAIDQLMKALVVGEIAARRAVGFPVVFLFQRPQPGIEKFGVLRRQSARQSFQDFAHVVDRPDLLLRQPPDPGTLVQLDP